MVWSRSSGGNYGWKILGWGGTNYSGRGRGQNGHLALQSDCLLGSSIAASAIAIYDGLASTWRFRLVTALKDKSMRKLTFNHTELITETVLFKGAIGRIRDIKIHPISGDIFLLSDNGQVWKMTPKKQ